jgi:Sec-independent protein translocase protein TatA
VFDLSPEKLMVLLAVGLVVLGPHRLPGAARTLARGLLRARTLADSVTSPVHASLQEPRRVLDDALAELRATVQPTAPASSRVQGPSPTETPPDPNRN